MDFSALKYDSTYGEGRDLKFLYEDNWLKDSEVRHNIIKRSGRWYVYMVFISVKNPYRFLQRQIEHYESEKKAFMYAELFRRNSAKDVRGTLKTDDYALNICHN
jgi:hypothetical protein